MATPNHMTSNEGQTVVLPDGRCFRFIWSGSITETRPSALSFYANETPRTDQKCRRCGKEFAVGELHYNRRAPNTPKKSRHYCLACASLVGLIEERLGPVPRKMEVPEARTDV